MKKIFKLILSLILLISLSSCGIFSLIEDVGNATIKGITSLTKKDVVFVYNNGQNDLVVRVEKGDTVTKPKIDPKKDYYVFDAWFQDETCTKLYDFSKPVESSMSLYAGYFLDTEKTSITENILSTNITIKNVSYTETQSGLKHNYIGKSGSGVIFDQDNDYYYAFTNNHVIYVDSSRNSVIYNVYDYKGYEYPCEVVSCDFRYDLAVVKFPKLRSLNLIEFGTSDPLINSTVISIGQPNGVKNTITYGRISSYAVVNVTDVLYDESNVKFEVINHTAEIHSGSSGGALLDSKLKLVGINFAGGEDEFGNFLMGSAVPLSKLKEYLTKKPIKSAF